MSLKIFVKSASNLRNLESVGKSDPYVSLSFQGERKKTQVKNSTLDPVWEEELTWDIGAKEPQPDDVIEVTVKDYERIGWNKLLGKTTIPLRNILHGGSGTLDLDQTLMDADNQPTTGILKMAVTYASPKGKKGNVPSGMQIGQSSTDVTDARLIPSGHEETDGTGYTGGMPVTGGLPQQRPRDLLSSVKTKFQVRVRVVEGRQLLGADVNPVCRVSLGSDTKQTRVHRGTSSPWFDELFYFHTECMPSDIMEDFLEFKVCNSSLLRFGTVIGTFKCEVGLIYDQKERSFVNKWLVLAHPDEPTPTVQGYLKVCMAVLGPGGVCPDLTAQRGDQDDVESNLLWSAGVHLQPATFKLSVYCAQNLPRMDSGTMQTLKEIFGIGKASKELVDPYVIASYAGREVQTKILYTNDNPEFRQDLYLGFLFPSMCNTLRITLMDWDRVGDDDVIGTAIIPISSISAPGEDGFLPTFGPAYVNVYGSRREWEIWQSGASEKMDEGHEEGCSYRGRLLVSLETVVGSYPPSPVANMDEEIFRKVRRYRATRRFSLMAQVSNVFLLKEAGRPLEVEISMGNFGNKLENSLLPSPSSTNPTNPVFDGCKYYYLPWGEITPLISLNCEWEDITHRLHASNHICSVIEELESDVRCLNMKRRARKGKENGTDITELQKNLLERLCDNCSAPLPEPDPIRSTETSLDSNLRKERRTEMDKLANKARSLLNQETDQVLEEVQGILTKLKELAAEPQSSMPDIFLWLMSGTERLAYARVSAASILHSSEPKWAGKCAAHFKTLTLKYPGKGSEEVAGVIRVSLWLGREEEIRSWWTSRPDLQLTVYAETYENQVVLAPGTGKWTTKGPLMTRSPFSDADGLRFLPKDCFSPSPGWKFQGDWFIDPDPSIRFSVDAGHTVFAEEVFEQHARVPGGNWIEAPTTWADARGDPATPRAEIQCPVGWQWRDLWTTDLQRAVDEEGWEYTVQKGVTGWSPQQKLYHVLRRRRWYRERQRIEKVDKMTAPVEGWEYALLFGLRFHARERKVDAVRRRRWRRKLVPTEPGLPPTPRIMLETSEGDKSGDGGVQVICPRQYVVSSEVHHYQLRAHIYQARDLAAGDKSGLSDPYAVVSFCGSTQQTEKQKATLCPTWDETLVFDDVIISGPLIGLMSGCHLPPSVAVEVYDWDARGEPEFLGRVFCQPHLVDLSHGYEPPSLQWHNLTKGNLNKGELLAAFELLLKGAEELPMPPPSRGDLFMVPFGLRPLLQRSRLEILCWGVRNMATYDLQSVTRPSIEFECGGQRVTSDVMSNIRSNPNFDKPHLVFDVELPKEELYMPPLTMRVMDHRAFGSKPVVATAVVSDLHHYNFELQTLKETHSPQFTTTDSYSTPKPGTVDTDIDWWAKYYASVKDRSRCGSYMRKGYECLQIVDGALEDLPHFNGFTDLVDTIQLMRGRGDSAQKVGEFKGTFRIYPLSVKGEEPPMVLSTFPSPAASEIVVRVYVVAGEDLAPKDSGGSSDPYIVVSLGNQKCSGKSNYKPNTLCPIFGQMYEITGKLPLHKDLKIQVWDYDKVVSDDLIGETTIDLENRYLSQYRATVGLAKQYHVSGANAWRDPELPSEILEATARLRHVDGPTWTGSHNLTLGGKFYSINDFEPENSSALPSTVGPPRERLALYVLHEVFPLVPEHVERRDLFHPARPGLPQGCLLLWVDIFPPGITLPPPVDITPRSPKKYELRVSIYNIYDVPLQESNIAGEQMSDVYVKGWLQGTNNVLKTDIHYRCMDGEANFNWRFIFPLDFIETEQMMVVQRKSHFWSAEFTEERRPPQLTLQLWDNDLVLRDDYLSEMTLDLCSLPKPARSSDKVKLSQITQPLDVTTQTSLSDGNYNILSIPSSDTETSYVNLFEVKRVYGYFPFSCVIDGNIEVAGKLEAEMEVVPEEEITVKPAGLGRDEPNANPHLEEPKRPATSFLWFTSPWKSFRHILWKNYKWYIITFIVLFFLILFIFLLLYSLPGATIDYLIGVE